MVLTHYVTSKRVLPGGWLLRSFGISLRCLLLRFYYLVNDLVRVGGEKGEGGDLMGEAELQ